MCDSSQYVRFPLARLNVLGTHSIHKSYGSHFADVAYADPPARCGGIRKVVLLLHGYNTHAESWSPVFIGMLVRIGCRVVMPSYSDKFLTIAGAARDAAAVLEDAMRGAPGACAVVVGHSMGGMIAQELAYLSESGPHSGVPLAGVVLAGTSTPVFLNPESCSALGVDADAFVSGYNPAQKSSMRALEPGLTRVLTEVIRSAQALSSGDACDDTCRRYKQLPGEITTLLQSVHAMIRTAKLLGTMYVRTSSAESARPQRMQHAESELAILDQCEQLLPKSFDDLVRSTSKERRHSPTPLWSTAIGVNEHVRNCAQMRAVLKWMSGSDENHIVRHSLLHGRGRARPQFALVCGGRDVVFPPEHMHHLHASIGPGATVSCIMCPRATHTMTRVFDGDLHGVRKVLHRGDMTFEQYCDDAACYLYDSARLTPGIQFIVAFVQGAPCSQQADALCDRDCTCKPVSVL